MNKKAMIKRIAEKKMAGTLMGSYSIKEDSKAVKNLFNSMSSVKSVKDIDYFKSNEGPNKLVVKIVLVMSDGKEVVLIGCCLNKGFSYTDYLTHVKHHSYEDVNQTREYRLVTVSDYEDDPRILRSTGNWDKKIRFSTVTARVIGTKRTVSKFTVGHNIREINKILVGRVLERRDVLDLKERRVELKNRRKEQLREKSRKRKKMQEFRRKVDNRKRNERRDKRERQRIKIPQVRNIASKH